MEERVQKILARAGYGSRRSCEELIRAGRVRINGQVATLGSKADASRDHITLDGTEILKAEAPQYYALHKPRGIISSVSDPVNRRTVRDLLPVSGTLYPIGRLDEDSEGLVIMTNDGELANRLTHPKFGHEKEYKVLVARQPDEQQLEAIRHGIVLDDGYRTAPAYATMESAFGKGAWLKIILKEGRKRQIREMGDRIGLPVVRILRVRIGALKIGSLKPGEWRPLKADEVRSLKQPVSTPARTRSIVEKNQPPEPKPRRLTRPHNAAPSRTTVNKRPASVPGKPKSIPKTPRK